MYCDACYKKGATLARYGSSPHSNLLRLVQQGFVGAGMLSHQFSLPHTSTISNIRNLIVCWPK
jgi:hypothetical protein